jgi:hypothetical protein
MKLSTHKQQRLHGTPTARCSFTWRLTRKLENEVDQFRGKVQKPGFGGLLVCHGKEMLA